MVRVLRCFFSLVEMSDERRRRIQAENEAAERKARESLVQRQEHLARLEFERSAAAREEAARKMREASSVKAPPQNAPVEAEQIAEQNSLVPTTPQGARALFDRGVVLLNGIGVPKDPKGGQDFVFFFVFLFNTKLGFDQAHILFCKLPRKGWSRQPF